MDILIENIKMKQSPGKGVRTEQQEQGSQEQEQGSGLTNQLGTGVRLDKSTNSILRKRSRMQKNADVRKAIIILSKRYSDASNKELSGILNITESAISKILSGRYKETDYLNLVIKQAQAKNKLISQA